MKREGGSWNIVLGNIWIWIVGIVGSIWSEIGLGGRCNPICLCVVNVPFLSLFKRPNVLINMYRF